MKERWWALCASHRSIPSYERAMKKTASHNQNGEYHQEGLLQLTLEGLIPPNQILVLNLELRTATLFYNVPEGNQTMVEQQHFSPNGMRVLVPLLRAYPKYCLHEVLFASLVSLPLEEAYQQRRGMRAPHPLGPQSRCQPPIKITRIWRAGALHPWCRISDRTHPRRETPVALPQP